MVGKFPVELEAVVATVWVCAPLPGQACWTSCSNWKVCWRQGQGLSMTKDSVHSQTFSNSHDDQTEAHTHCPKALSRRQLAGLRRLRVSAGCGVCTLFA